jgi:hypothetical protein
MAQDIHDQINDYQRQLDKGLELQEIMKNSNAIIKKFEANKIDREQAKSQLVEVGLSLSQVDKILEPDFMGRKGFGSYKLTNNNANNKRIKDRIEVLKKKLQGAKEVQKSGQAEEYVFDGGTIEVNYEIDRVQILFPGGRVDKDLFKKLRSNGYVYSPTNKAFQRKITPQAIRNAIYLFDAKKVATDEVTETEMDEMVERGTQGLKGDLPEVTFENETPKTEETKTESELNPRDSWYIKTQGTPYGIDRALLSLVKNGNNEVFEKDFKRVMSNPNYNTKEKFIEGINDEQTDILQKINKKEKEVNEWVERGGPHLKKLPKYDEWQNDIKALKILENHLSVLDAIAEHYFDEIAETNETPETEDTKYYDKLEVVEGKNELVEYFKDKQSGEIVTEEEMTGMVDEDDQLDSFYSIGEFKSKEDAEKSLLSETMVKPISNKPATHYVMTNQNVFGTAKGMIGMILSKPNMFQTEVYFGKNQGGQVMSKKIDNGYLDKLTEIPTLKVDGKSEVFELPKKAETLGQASGGAFEEYADIEEELISQLELQGELTRSDAQGILEANEEFAKDQYGIGVNTPNIATKILALSKKADTKKSEPFFREVGSDGYDSDIHKSKKENGEYVLKDAEKEALKYRDFKDDLHELDLWVEYEFPTGTQRHYRKFTFTPEQVKSGVMREITDYGVKETGYSELPNGNISVIISVANGSIANSLSNLWMKLNPIELMTETHFEPNTPEEFDEAIFEHLDEMKSAEWIGHLMKQRLVLREINSELHGPENEKKAEVKRLFKAFYEREKADKEYEGSTILKYDPSNPWITDETSEPKTITTASIKREANFYQKITSAIIPKIEPHWIGKETSEVALRNQIWNEIQKDTTSNVSSNEDKVKAMNEIYDQVFNAEREKKYGYDKELAEQYATILNMNPEEFNQKFGIKKFFINDYLRASFTFKDNSNSVIDLTLNCVQMELYANITANAWERTSDIAFFLRNAVQYLDDQPDLILANLKTSNKEWTSHPKKYSKTSIEKEQPTMETKEQVAIGYSSNSGTSEGGTHFLYSLDTTNKTFYLTEPVESGSSYSDDWTGQLKDKKYNGLEYKWNIIWPSGTRVQVGKDKEDWNSGTYMYNSNVIDKWVHVIPFKSVLEKIKKSIENPVKKDEPMIETRKKLITSYLPSEQQASDDADDFLKKHVIVAKMPKQDEPKGTQEYLTKHYDNQYQLNKGIEEFMTNKGANPSTYSAEEKAFIKKYSGYGGLSKFGLGGKGAFFEYYTPTPVIRKMWALAYKYGYKGGPILESSVGTGEFLQLAPIEASITAYEINPFSADICRILYPQAKVFTQPFEQTFIENNFTMKDRVTPKYDLCIGNPPYGSFEVVKSRYLSDGMGEFKHVGPKNYAEYFLRRSMDLLKPGGLLILIIGADVINGGTLFLDSGPSDVKDYLAEHSTLLDAYRLPDSVFERTQVTTEIIVLQKK